MPNQTAPLDVARVRALLAGTRFADVRYVARTVSTNSDAQLILGSPGSLGTTIVAEYQSAGVGRKGRRWFAPPGSALLFTTILPHPIDSATLWAVPFWIALSIAGAVAQCCAIDLELVWPNDLHRRGGKAGGILSVARIAGNDAWVGCGVGLNVFRPTADAELDALRPQPAFLEDGSSSVERESLLAAILRTFDGTVDDLQHPDDVAARWESQARLAGTVYRYRSDIDGIEREGVAQRIGPHGALIVRDPHGEHAIDMADVRITGRADNN